TVTGAHQGPYAAGRRNAGNNRVGPVCAGVPVVGVKTTAVRAWVATDQIFRGLTADEGDLATALPGLLGPQKVSTLSMLTNIPWPVSLFVNRVPSAVALIVQPCAS